MRMTMTVMSMMAFESLSSSSRHLRHLRGSSVYFSRSHSTGPTGTVGLFVLTHMCVTRGHERIPYIRHRVRSILVNEFDTAELHDEAQRLFFFWLSLARCVLRN